MKVIIVGGGASGLICAIESARQGCQVTIIEHNEKVGKKIYITGKGRCNLTNLCSPSVFLTNVVTNSKFLYSSINVFSPQDTIEYFNKLGLLTVVERGQRVFPSSQKASDVTSALMREINRLGVTVLLNSDVQCINVAGNVVKSLTVLHKSASLSNNMTDIVVCDRLVLATGGRSYPTTGSNGSGYALAQSVGHNIIKCKPSLVGILANDCAQLSGLSLKNVNVQLLNKQGKVLREEFGELLFTHNGLSGPTILTISAYANKIDLNGCVISINLKPALTQQQLDTRLQRDFTQFSNKDLVNGLSKLLPQNLICFIIKECCLSANAKVNSITSQQRKRICDTIQQLQFKIIGLDSIDNAVVTSGGVDVKQINPTTMQSKVISNLYFCGEIIDVDALTGGFNMQIAFSTGYVAGRSLSSSPTSAYKV